MYLCDASAGNWCCDEGDVYKGCCSDKGNLRSLGTGTSVTVIGQAATSSSAAASSSVPASSTSSTISTPAQTTTGTASPTAAPSNDLGAKVGAGVGVPLGIALLAALGDIGFLGRKRSRDARGRPRDLSQTPSSYPPYNHEVPYNNQIPYNSDATKETDQLMLAELNTEPRPPSQLPS